MAIRNIVTLGDDVLRKVCRTQLTFDSKLHTILDDMKETMRKNNGVGIAAVQVGVLRRIFVVSVDGKYYECINPKIISVSGKQKGDEGCLSVKGKYGEVERPYRVKVSAYDRFGKPFVVNAEGFMARAFCHENDHLDGILYIDKAKEVFEE